uniref:Uncharacterized protein n=1 Tax=Arundo donax TaxID=35708 RepID=A0A0A9HEM1_ARUDO
MFQIQFFYNSTTEVSSWPVLLILKPHLSMQFEIINDENTGRFYWRTHSAWYNKT